MEPYILVVYRNTFRKNRHGRKYVPKENRQARPKIFKNRVYLRLDPTGRQRWKIKRTEITISDILNNR